MIAKSDATMLEDKFSVRSAPETPSDDTVGELATPDTTNSLGVAELSVIVSSIVRTIVVEVVAVEDMVGAVVSSLLVTAWFVKLAKAFPLLSSTVPDDCEYDTVIEPSDCAMLADKFSVRVLPETPIEETVGELATPPIVNSLAVAELSKIGSVMTRSIVVSDVVSAVEIVGAVTSKVLSIAWFVKSANAFPDVSSIVPDDWV